MRNTVSIGDGWNGVTMAKGDIVYAMTPDHKRAYVLGVLHISEDGIPYLAPFHAIAYQSED